MTARQAALLALLLLGIILSLAAIVLDTRAHPPRCRPGPFPWSPPACAPSGGAA